MKKLKVNRWAGGLIALAAAVVGISGIAKAEEIPNGMSVSPTSSKIVLSPGDSYEGVVTVSNPSNAIEDLSYEAHADSFFVDDDYAISLGTINDYTKMKDWITLSNESGTIPAGSSAEINYTISVPENAPAGGQYAAIVVATVPPQGGEGTTIREVWQIASPIYASIAGSSTLSGTISENNIPSFVLNPPVEASFVVENTGNVHADTMYYLQVYPLFSDEEIYTNEEDPEVVNVMPGTKRAVINSWNDAPQVGIFRIIQTVKAFGSESITEKTVIICPIWLLFLIIFIVVALIIWIVMMVSKHGKKSRASESA